MDFLVYPEWVSAGEGWRYGGKLVNVHALQGDHLLQKQGSIDGWLEDGSL